MSSVEIIANDDSIDAIETVTDTKNLGCGNSFKDGRCKDGSDSTDCVYDNINS